MDEPKRVPYHLHGELEQIAAWFKKEGLAPDSPKEAQLCLLWRAHQRSRSRLSSVTRDLEEQRSQHMAEMAEVRKSLEQIRIFTEHKDVLTQEIQDENDQLKDQLRRLISLQDAQISEVAKMLYQQGLTELIHSSPSEQVAYLLVERASLLETSEGPDRLTDGGGTSTLLGTEEQAMNTIVHQSSHKGAARHGQSPWKRLFGLHKAAQSKHTFIPAEAMHLAGQASRVERECSRLERDLEEGSRRLAMAHNEIRRLTDELESAHLTQRAYEPELQAAQQEVEQLRQEVEKLKKYEIVELRKAKELNDRLDLEIRALRNRVRCQEAEKTSVQQTVLSLRAEVEQLESSLQGQQLLASQARATRATESAKCHAAKQPQRDQYHENLEVELASQTRHLLQKEEAVVRLQTEVERLESALQEQRQQAERQLLASRVQADAANELAKAKASELSQSLETCRELQNKLSGHSKYISEKESEIHSLKQQLDNSQKHLDNLIASISSKQTNHQDPKPRGEREADSLLATENKVLRKPQPPQDTNTLLHQECSDYQEAIKNLIATQEKYETLKTEICETLRCLDKERSKNHEIKEKHKAKLCRAKRRIDDETTWRDEKIKTLERELSLCALSLAKEKELTVSITVENDKLLVERRRLLQQLSEEEHDKKDSSVTASLSKCRVDFLEMENRTLQNKILHMSNQRAVLERSLQSLQSLHLAEELKILSNPTQLFTSLPVKTSCVLTPEPSEIQGLLDKIQRKRTDVASSPLCLTSGSLPRSAEMGYLNLTSTQTPSDHPAPPAALSSSDSTCC